MEKRHLFVGIGIASLLIIAGYLLLFAKQNSGLVEKYDLLKIKKAEINLEKDGIKNIAGIRPKYEKIELDYYYKYDYCLEIVKTAIKKVNGLVELKNAQKVKAANKELLEALNLQEIGDGIPIAVLYGNADIFDYKDEYINSEDSFETVISGFDACSEKIVVYNLCSILKNQTELCSKIPIKEENIDAEKSIAPDLKCYKSCSIRYVSNNKLVSRTWQGPPCGRVDNYAEGESRLMEKVCLDNSCNKNEDDIGCCKPAECVDNGECYPLSISKDVDDDGQIESCILKDSIGVWANPDLNSDICSNAGFVWFNCANEEECRYGINNFGKKRDVLCCGDDKQEHFNQCKGKICNNNNDFACCGANSCVFNGKCYQSGCNDIELSSGEKISVFCSENTNSWVDLDDNNCIECLGKKAWSGTICCGDDPKEGKFPTQFIYNNKNGTSKVVHYGCTDKKSDCVYPDNEISFSEGFYVFKDDAQYLQGGYYCKDSQWHSLDNNSKYCKYSGYEWDDKKAVCCGDNANEFYIKGSDGTSACCAFSTDIVTNSDCYPTVLCGNNILNRGEQCELPNSQNNEYCSQQEYECLGNRLGTRNAKGNCSSQCLCEENEFTYACAKGNCNANCSNDNDCGQGGKCDLNSCSCKPKAYCGDNIVQKHNDYAQKEECELPSTYNNTYCKVEQCKNKKSISTLIGENYYYGTCENDCQCDYGTADYICKKNSCGAECSEDGSGCDEGMLCNTEACSCSPLPLVCGNDICEQGEEASCPSDCKTRECPYRIDLKLDRSSYYLNDTIYVDVAAYDKNNNPFPDVKFDLDVLVNDILVGSATYSTSSEGHYTIKKRVNNYAPRGVHRYIVRAKVPDCSALSDSETANLYVNNPYSIPPRKINFSRFEFVIDKFNITNEALPVSVCGDSIISYGEACEGINVCRPSFGCDYKNKIYDAAERCSNCDCPRDAKSEPNNGDYCANCNSCGDGEVNCGEECENGTTSQGLVCRNGRLYEKIDFCTSCRWVDDGIGSDTLIDTCECKCPKNPDNNCVNGDYINYTHDYKPGCSDGKCNSCDCADTYSKDSNKDGIEDKCAPELCGNRLDDNDNGVIDEQNCIWYYCSQCGYGLFNFCTRQECSKFEQGCFFNKFNVNIFGELKYSIGQCIQCSGIKACEEYKFDNVTCQNDPCYIGNCSWDGTKCCNDNDNDNECDLTDNCLYLYNPNQEDSDNDQKGDACESCVAEPLLFEPSEQKESSCNDQIDNDCDGFSDCKDADCAGIADCCQTENDCTQNSCLAESCANNKCEYTNKPFCDNSECQQGAYCDADGICREPDASFNVCLYCIADSTNRDSGIGYGNLFSTFPSNSNGLCCGNQPDEYYIVQNDTLQSACCNAESACVDEVGKCYSSNTPSYENHYQHCSINSWYECDGNRSALCSEAGSNYNYNTIYQSNNETGWYCTYDGLSFGWRRSYPKEICNDGIDNDCDKNVDFNDEECIKIAENKK